MIFETCTKNYTKSLRRCLRLCWFIFLLQEYTFLGFHISIFFYLFFFSETGDFGLGVLGHESSGFEFQVNLTPPSTPYAFTIFHPLVFHHPRNSQAPKS